MTSTINFKTGNWSKKVDVRDFIQLNYAPYYGDASFLSKATDDTTKLWKQVLDLCEAEKNNNGTLDIDVNTISTIVSHKPGYIDKALEKIIGLQTDAPLKRAVMPFGGIRMVESACEAYGYELNKDIKDIFYKYRKTHNEGVFDAYTSEMQAARKAGIITGLPDAYGRGRIIGDYRRVALYGVDLLIEDKKTQLSSLELDFMDEDTIRLREEIAEQIKALKELKIMGTSYGFDISKPATNSFEAIQWLYLGYLAAVKEQNGAAMSLGRELSFLILN